MPSNTIFPWPITSSAGKSSSAMVSFCSTSSTPMPLRLSSSAGTRPPVPRSWAPGLGGLVDHDQVGVAHQRTAQREHLLLAAGQHAGLGVLALQQRGNSRTCPRSPSAAFLRCRFARPAAGSGAPSACGKDVAVLGHVADAGGRSRRPSAQHQLRSPLKCTVPALVDQAHDGLTSGGAARAVAAQQATISPGLHPRRTLTPCSTWLLP